MSTAAEVSDLLVAIERHDLGLDYPARFRQAVSAVIPPTQSCSGS